MKNSFKKEFRIKKQKDITSILQHGARWKCNIFAVIYRKNSLGQDRLAVLVSKKNGPAVERVRIKRIYREAYTNTPVEGHEGLDILIRPYYGREHSFHEVLKLYGRWRTNCVQEVAL